MGLFGSRKKTFVDTSVVRVVEDDLVPNLVQKSVVESVFQGGNISENLIENLLNDSTTRFNSAYRYGRDHYHFGLPDAKITSYGDSLSVMQVVLDTIHNQSVNIEYAEFAPLNNIHMGWKELFENRGYDSATNEITSLSATIGFIVYLDRIIPTYNIDPNEELPEPGTWAEWGTSSLAGYTPERAQQDGQVSVFKGEAPRFGTSVTEGAEIHYIWVDANGDIQKDFFFLDLSSYDVEEEYFQARYTYDDSGSTVTGIFTYLKGEGTYPTLDAEYDLSYLGSGTYFPFALFRRDDQNRSRESVRNTPEFLTTEKLMSYFGMDFIEVNDIIHDNPDIDDIDQAVFMLAVPANSQEQVEIDYLFKFFDRLNDLTPYSAVDTAQLQSNPNPLARFENFRTNKTIETQESKGVYRSPYAITFRDADFRFTLSYGGIIKTTISGSIGAVGTCTNEISTTTYETSFYDTREASGNSILTYAPGINRIYRKQITTNFYEEIIVIDPTVRYSIEGTFGVVANAKDDKLLIPIDKIIADTFSQIELSVLYPRSMHFVFNARVVQKLEWYETGFFKFVLVVIAVIISIVSFGTASPLAGLIAAAGAGLVALSLYLLKVIIYQVITNYLFRLVVKELGIEFALFLAIATAGLGLANLNSTALNPATLPPNLLLQLSNGLLRGIDLVTEDLLEDLKNDIELFNNYASEQQARLEEAQNLLEQDTVLSPFVIFGETPDQYYSRTIHSGNIGMTGIQFIESFVDISLTLPDIDDTLGGLA